jgi:hypothetical protein
VGVVTLSVSGFSGTFEASFRSTDFPRFADDLAKLYRSLSGTAEFVTDEPQLGIVVEGDGRGHFAANCYARDTAGIGNKLTFRLFFDQTEIPTILGQLEAIAQNSPVRGAPAA